MNTQNSANVVEITSSDLVKKNGVIGSVSVTLHLKEAVCVIIQPDDYPKIPQFSTKNHVVDIKTFCKWNGSQRLGICAIDSYALIPRITLDVLAYVALDDTNVEAQSFDENVILNRLENPKRDALETIFWKKNDGNDVVWNVFSLCSKDSEYLQHGQKCSLEGFECIVVDKKMLPELQKASERLISALQRKFYTAKS